MMDNHKKRVPDVRFKGFSDNWEQRKLSSIVSRVKSYSLSRDVETKEYTGYKYIHYGDIHTKIANIIDKSSNLPNINIGNYDLLRKGDIVLADASEDYQGIATPAVITISPPYKLVSGLHTIALRPKQIDSLFLYYFIHSSTFRKFGYKMGTGMKVFGISVTNLLKFKGTFPTLEEQKKVGEFFKKLDDTLDLHQSKLSKLQQMKKGLIQAMLPKNRSIVPRLRFSNFGEEWEQCKAIDIFKSVSDKNHPELPVLSASQEKGMILRDSMGIDIKYDKKSLNTYKRVLPGQFVMHLRSFQGGFAYSSLEGITSPAYTVLDFKNRDEQSSIFWHFILSSENFIKRLETVTYGIRDGKSISYSDFSTLKFNVPPLAEQIRIGEILASLDNIIFIHQKKLDKLQEFKKAYLQKMFI